MGALGGTSSLTAGNISNCFSTGIIEMYAGGIIGWDSNYSEIKNCYSTGDIGPRAGGIVGYSDRYINCYNCYSTGVIFRDVGRNEGGGIYGGQYFWSCPKNCYATNGGKGQEEWEASLKGSFKISEGVITNFNMGDGFDFNTFNLDQAWEWTSSFPPILKIFMSSPWENYNNDSAQFNEMGPID